jgi:hypothetical protein
MARFEFEVALLLLSRSLYSDFVLSQKVTG